MESCDPGHAGRTTGGSARGRRLWGVGWKWCHEKRTIFVETTSSPSNLPVSVSVGFSDSGDFDTTTPDARNVRTELFCTPLEDCTLFGSAGVTGDRAGKNITLCLTDFGRRRCATSNDGFVVVNAEVDIN
jgi:hypothetical protein